MPGLPTQLVQELNVGTVGLSSNNDNMFNTIRIRAAACQIFLRISVHLSQITQYMSDHEYALL